MGRGRKKKSSNHDEDNGFGAWGGYMAAKKSKLLEQYTETANLEVEKLSNIFKGVSIFVNGYTRPSAEELKSLMALHGGIYHHYHMPAKTTHIIASNLPDTKIKQLGGKEKIVKPEWITDSIKSNKLLDYSNYLLYTNHNRLQPKLNFPKIASNNTKEVNASSDDTKVQLSPDIFDTVEVENFDNITAQTDHVPDETEDKSSENNQEIISKIDRNVDTKPAEDKKPTRTLSAKDPRFLSEFYSNSRLHHISTLGAMFKQHICNLRENSNGKFPAREYLKNHIKSLNSVERSDLQDELKDNSVIMHIDMDCFFVSVELRSHPELVGQPVAVTHSKGGQEPSARAGVNRQAEIECYKQKMQERLGETSKVLGPGNMLTRLETVENSSMSEIASCSYEARKAGVKNGMFMGQALKLCPNLRTIPYDFEGYKEVAHTLYNTIAEYTLNIEAVSCDEMFVDISEVLSETGATVDQWATYIRNLISEKTKCPCSTGFGSNRLQARMATKKAKPNGQFYLSTNENVKNYMSNINVKELPGIGRSISLKLHSMNVKTCGDLQSYTLAQLQSIFGGKFGENLYNHCRGIDEKPLVYEHERKSVSAEVNYGIRFKDNVESENFIIQLCEEVHSRLTDIKMKGKCITLKLMVRSKDAPVESSKFMGHGVCDYITKSSTLTTATSDLEIIKKEILQICHKLNQPPSELRGIGIQISRLEKLNNKNSHNTLTKFFKTKSTENCSFTVAKPKTELPSTSNKQNNVNLSKASVSVGREKDSGITIPVKMDTSVLSNPVTESVKNVVKKEATKIIAKPSSINQNITRTGKRGRPKGSTTNKSTRKINNVNNGNNLQNFFNTMNNEPRNTTPTIEVDYDVLNALPEDIQKEIIQQYNLKKLDNDLIKPGSSSKIPPKQSIEMVTCLNTSETKVEIDSRDFKNTPKEINDEICENVENDKKEQSMFLGMNFVEVRQLLREWVHSENIPEPCDIEMLAEYFKTLALDSNIEDLFVMLKFLYNEITKENKCAWHRAYFEIVNIAQKGMIEKYGYSMYVYKNFNCDNKNCTAMATDS